MLQEHAAETENAGIAFFWQPLQGREFGGELGSSSVSRRERLLDTKEDAWEVSCTFESPRRHLTAAGRYLSRLCPERKHI